MRAAKHVCLFVLSSRIYPPSIRQKPFIGQLLMFWDIPLVNARTLTAHNFQISTQLWLVALIPS